MAISNGSSLQTYVDLVLAYGLTFLVCGIDITRHGIKRGSNVPINNQSCPSRHTTDRPGTELSPISNLQASTRPHREEGSLAISGSNCLNGPTF
jgi:hypothetical protein